MIISINMQDLLPLDTQNTIEFIRSRLLALLPQMVAYPESTHSVNPIAVSKLYLPLHAGFQSYLYQGR